MLLPVGGRISSAVEAEVELAELVVAALGVLRRGLYVDVPVRLCLELRSPHVIHHGVPLDPALRHGGR